MVLPHQGHVDNAEAISARRQTNLAEPQRFCQDQWLKIQPEACQKLMDGYQKHLIEMKMANGHLTKY